MTANTGRTNAKWIGVFLDNAAGTLTDLSAYCKDVGTFGLAKDEQDVTAYSDGVKNVTIGRPDAPITLKFQWDTVVYTHLIALGSVTPRTLDIRVGIEHAWEAGEPCFGITSSATVGYVLKDLTATDSEITATFRVKGATAPDWATAAHT